MVLLLTGTPLIEKSASGAVADVVRLEEARKLWIEESKEGGDLYTAGKAAYDIGSLTRDPKWTNQAIIYLGKARSKMPQFSLSTAYLGSAHALMARDFPLQGLWQLLHGPGFVRIHHVWKATSLLNEAVKQDPENPTVRLIRAATAINMPSILTDHSVALTDFDLMAEWDADPEVNPTYVDVLQSFEWQHSFYTFYAETLSEQGKIERASFYQEKLNVLSKEDG